MCAIANVVNFVPSPCHEAMSVYLNTLHAMGRMQTSCVTGTKRFNATTRGGIYFPILLVWA
jgi:hypothetical protein